MGGGSYPSAEVQSVYSIAPAADLATGHSLVGGGSYPFAEVQSVYSIAPAADLATGHSLVGGGLIPLQRCSRCILQPQPTGQQVVVNAVQNDCHSSRIPIQIISIADKHLLCMHIYLIPVIQKSFTIIIISFKTKKLNTLLLFLF